ncbi:MAG: flagellar basal body L-ring protein FlgH [Hyphomicrobiaceae bacterium]
MKHVVVCAFAVLAAGCGVNVQDIGREPALTPVGSGMKANTVAMVMEPTQAPRYRRGNSIWQDQSADLFRDTRAMKVGDVVTVKIAMRDRASLDNSTNRSRESSRGFTGAYDFAVAGESLFKGTGLNRAGNGSINGTFTGSTSSEGKGAIERSESIEVQVAAVVNDVMPNGNLVISGSQEVRVNQEVRELRVAGLVRPRDISTDNVISSDKIAEARISYGGRGRIMEVQQPGWGHQIVDVIWPF